MVEEEADALSDALPSERVLVTQPLLISVISIPRALTGSLE
jgi:hypothetical protein